VIQYIFVSRSITHFLIASFFFAGIAFSMLNTVKELFASLVEKGLALTLVTQPDWRTQLPQELHCFAGNYHDFPGYGRNPHRCYIYADEDQAQFIALKLAPPTSIDSFFKAESYAKHLIGLVRSWSTYVVVVLVVVFIVVVVVVVVAIAQYSDSHAVFLAYQYCLVKTHIWKCV
jgi:hypothetical protein